MATQVEKSGCKFQVKQVTATCTKLDMEHGVAHTILEDRTAAARKMTKLEARVLNERSVGMAMSNGCIVRSRPNTVVRNKRPEFANDVESGARGQGDNNEAGEML